MADKLDIEYTNTHQAMVHINGTEHQIMVHYSYWTPVAFVLDSNPIVVRVNKWGSTTGKLVNALDNRNYKDRLDDKTFMEMLNLALSTVIK